MPRELERFELPHEYENAAALRALASYHVRAVDSLHDLATAMSENDPMRFDVLSTAHRHARAAAAAKRLADAIGGAHG